MNDPSDSWTNRPTAIFWIVTAAAFVLRLVHIVLISDPVVNPAFIAPVTDAGVHHRWAQEILSGAWPGPEPFFRAPLYPYFLAGLYVLFGPDSPLAVQLVHGLVSAVGAGLAALCAGRLWDARAAWCAGLLLACLWSSIYFAGELLAVTLSVSLNLWLLWLLLAPLSSRGLLLSGAVLGLSALARPTILVTTPIIAWHLWHRGDLRRSDRLPGWLWLALGLVLAIAPVSLRNLVHGGEPVLIAASGGVNFYIGNNERADGRVAYLPGAPPAWQGEMADAVALATREIGRPVSALGADRYFWRQGVRFWREKPAAAVRLTARKVWLLLANGERSNNKNLAFWRARSPLLRWPIWPGWALVLGLATLGLGRGDLDARRRRLLLGLVVTYAAALILFFINARFRLPVLAWLTVPAGGGLAWLLIAARGRSWAGLSRRAGVVAALATLVSFVPDALTYRQNPATDFDSWRILGNSYLAAGDPERAATTWEKALAIDAADPRDTHRWNLPRIYRPLVQLHLQARRSVQAVDVQRRWVERLPESDAARTGLANLLLQEDRPAEAIEHLETVLQRTPDHAEARLGYGWALHQAGRDSLALQAFARVNRPQDELNATFGAAQCLLSLKQWSAAETQLQAIVAREAGFWQAYASLGELYALTGQADRERRSWQQLLRYQPRHRRAQERLAQLQGQR